ncbi:MAG TPA: 50S ribosomal protein L10 [Candidatus Babeliales bacterium]|nr:50S ribosomal protein L10 [Candidatus Babeliales bacterium]
MALDRQKKAQNIDETVELLRSAKLTVIAQYSGTSVKSMQQLRRKSSEDGTKVKVIKNRLFKKALDSDQKYKDIDTAVFTGQLLFAFNSQDEVAPAQSLAKFAKEEPQIEFVGGLNSDGQFLSAHDISVLASLPSKDQLRAQLIGTINAPLSGFVNVLAGNVRGVLNVLNARSEQLN